MLPSTLMRATHAHRKAESLASKTCKIQRCSKAEAAVMLTKHEAEPDLALAVEPNLFAAQECTKASAVDTA